MPEAFSFFVLQTTRRISDNAFYVFEGRSRKIADRGTDGEKTDKQNTKDRVGRAEGKITKVVKYLSRQAGKGRENGFPLKDCGNDRAAKWPIDPDKVVQNGFPLRNYPLGGSTGMAK